MYKVNLSKLKQSRIYIAILLITFIIYGNSINNEYALDDNIVVDGVSKVEKGIKGIPEIFTTHHATGKKQNYGYRPLVLVTFALEKTLFGKLPVTQTLEEKKRKDKLTQANLSHFVNVCLYAIICIVLFSFLLQVFADYNLLLSFVITLLFLVHPLHTEVVNNIKSRDELLMLLMMLLSLKSYLKFGLSNSKKHLFFGATFVFLAMLSKKNSIALLGMIPIVLYFKNVDYKKIIIATFSAAIFIVLFTLSKKGLISVKGSREVLFFENPLKYQGGFMERLTMAFYCSWFYFKMLIYPVNLSFYYGYNQIPLANWSNWQVWAGMLFYIPLGVYGFIQLIKRNIIGLGLALWLGLMLGVVNLFFPIVGIVADRFTFSFSIGFCIVVGYLLFKVFKLDTSKEVYNLKLPQMFLVVLGGMIVLYSYRTIQRNPDWENYMVLYTNDLEHLQESAKANALWANTYYPILGAEVQKNRNDPSHLKNAEKLIFHYKEAIRIDPSYITSNNNLGSAYLNFLGQADSAVKYCGRAIALNPEYEEAHYNLALAYEKKGIFEKSIYHYAKVIELNPENSRVYTAFNNLVIKQGLLNKGIANLEEVASNSLNPKNIYVNIGNLYSMDNYNVKQSLIFFVKAFELDPNDKKLCAHIATLYQSIGNITEANKYSLLCNT